MKHRPLNECKAIQNYRAIPVSVSAVLFTILFSTPSFGANPSAASIEQPSQLLSRVTFLVGEPDDTSPTDGEEIILDYPPISCRETCEDKNIDRLMACQQGYLQGSKDCDFFKDGLRDICRQWVAGDYLTCKASSFAELTTCLRQCGYRY